MFNSKIFKLLRKSMCKQNSHKSDCSMRSSLIWDIVFALISNLIVDSLDELV